MSRNPTTIVMNIMNSILFLVVITSTSLISCSSSNNEQADIFMVVDDQISTTRAGMTKVVDSPVQIGQVKIRDGKLLTLARFMKNIQQESVINNPCVYEGQPCGYFDPCCGNLICTDIIQGKCVPPKPCITEHQPCGVLDPCCAGLKCDGFFQGECLPAF
ncbi:hypothetical protein QVD17_14771 [Tagetes erecta]|uniref:Uncharacterized protein n=1 Tax=Tagetes erecta TaxID=13708 RepID=A0AAD8KNK1_TARER|nr:hypothetical protein QVD17_14771 [Tagetes erecta]